MGAVRLMTKEAEEALFLVAEARLFGGITCPKMEESRVMMEGARLKCEKHA
jgi:hypothetical protein